MSGGVHFHGLPARRGGREGEESGDGDLPRPRQLPGDVRHFVNRAEELRRLDALLTGETPAPGGPGGTGRVAVCVIAGTAGAGKTSLALRWAHTVQADFPDGQLYVNLRGYDPGAPVTAREALHGFLTALGVPAAAVPSGTEAAATLYRSLLAGRRLLIVLDNAAAASQVRPLLPGSADCLVIVTSRSRLSGLSVRDGAHRLTLGTLPADEAVALLRTVTSGYRPEDDADKLAELSHLCARLPLALRIAAERAASRPHMSVDQLIKDLRDESSLWDALTVGDDEEAEAVRTVFAWSYRALAEDAARFFRLLGLHPGPAFGQEAAAALAATAPGVTRRLLDTLVGAHLLEQTAPDRFEFHDLLRAYATDQAQDGEPEEERAAARERVLAWYLHTAQAARRRLTPAEAGIPLAALPEGVTPGAFADYEAARRWYETERGNVLAAAHAAADAGLEGIAWQLPAVLAPVYAQTNVFDDWFAMNELGLRAARRAGERAAEAKLLDSSGKACLQTHRLAEATAHQRAALALCRELGDRTGEARALNALGLIAHRSRRLAEARGHFAQALALYQELGEEWWEPTSLANLAMVSYEAGDLDAAAEELSRSLEGHRQRGDERGEGNALRILSAVQRERGEPAEALASAERSVAIARRYRNLLWEGFWLLELGSAQQAHGQAGEALVTYQRAAALQRRLGDRAREARAWHGAGEAYTLLGRPEDAEAFFRRAAAQQRELGDDWHLALALDGLARALREEEREEREEEGPAEGAGDGTAGGESRGARAQGYWAEAARLLGAFDDARATALRARIRRVLDAQDDGPREP